MARKNCVTSDRVKRHLYVGGGKPVKLGVYEKIVMALAEETRRYLIGRHVAPEVAADTVQDMFVKILEMALILAPDKLRPY